MENRTKERQKHKGQKKKKKLMIGSLDRPSELAGA